MIARRAGPVYVGRRLRMLYLASVCHARNYAGVDAED